tara:strand:- start:153 stop:527 length:375 start_codon:yes stop_codon:yes gene_type:complete
LLTGCASVGEHTLPKGGDMTMAQIYKQTNGLSVKNKGGQAQQYSVKEVRAKLGKMKTSDYKGYTRNATNEINNLFKPMKNPEVSMYVFPQLVETKGGTQYPMPGYSTGFFLFSSNYYAMPSEHY